MVAIVKLPALEGSKQQTVDHVAEEIRFLRLLAFGHRNMGQHFFLEDFLGIAQSAVPRKTSSSTAVPDKIESDL